MTTEDILSLLTPREITVARLTATIITPSEIATALDLDRRTIHGIEASIRKKLRVRTRCDLFRALEPLRD